MKNFEKHKTALDAFDAFLKQCNECGSCDRCKYRAGELDGSMWCEFAFLYDEAEGGNGKV